MSLNFDYFVGEPILTNKQVFPSAHRGTGNGVAIGLNRIMGIVSAVVGEAANVSSTALCPRMNAHLKIRLTRRFQSTFVPRSTLSWLSSQQPCLSNHMADEAVKQDST